MESTGRYNKDMGIGDGALSSSEKSTTVAAVFADRERAHDAVSRLHDEGYRDTWIGITRSDETSDYATSATAPTETRVESENWFTRFFGEGDESLHEALVKHGVSEIDARSAAGGMLAAQSAIVTVDGANHPELAAQVISEAGGQLITRGFGATGYGTSGTYGYGSATSQSPASRTSSLAEDDALTAGGLGVAGGLGSSTEPELSSLGATGREGLGVNSNAYNDYGQYRAGAALDESTRLQLREERLRIDKSRVSIGEATVGKEVVTETHNIDVPLIREELFIERRPASASTVADTSAFGSERDVIRVPLTQEEVAVSKTQVVTEEVTVGKRQVEETQQVSETTRKEQLTVNDASSASNLRGATDTRL